MKKASRKWGLFYYWCGWACIIVATAALIYGFLTLESSAHAGFLIGRSIVVYLMGGYWLRKGQKEIAKARIDSILKDITPEGFSLKELPPKEH